MNKKILVLIAVLALAFNLDAQTYSAIYALNSNLSIRRCNINGQTIGTDSVIAHRGEQFRDNGNGTAFTDEGGRKWHVIYILPFHTNLTHPKLYNEDKNNTRNKAALVKIDGTSIDGATKMKDTEPNYLLLSDSVFLLCSAVTTSPKHNFIVYASTLPIKLRFGKRDSNGNYLRYTDIANDINLGGAFGYKWRMTKTDAVFLDILAGMTFDGIAIDSASTHNTAGASKKAFGLSFFGGAALEIYKFQIAVFVGGDLIPGSIGSQWVYKRSPWLGFGIGYTLFSPQSNQKNPKNDR